LGSHPLPTNTPDTATPAQYTVDGEVYWICLI
jgi:hypothetical protein